MNTTINPKMHPDVRTAPDRIDTEHLDYLLFNALTVESRGDVQRSRMVVSDLAVQCLQHINCLSNLEAHCRSVAAQGSYDHDEVAFSAVIKFLAGMGTSLGSVLDQLRCIPDQDLQSAGAIRNCATDTAGFSPSVTK